MCSLLLKSHQLVELALLYSIFHSFLYELIKMHNVLMSSIPRNYGALNFYDLEAFCFEIAGNNPARTVYKDIAVVG